MKKLIGILAALVMLFSTQAFAIGAIAVDDEVGEDEPGYGMVVGEDTKDAARAGALKECRAAGNKACKVVAWFETCGAYASSKKYYGAGWGATKKAAEAMAMSKCSGKCKIQVSDCE